MGDRRTKPSQNCLPFGFFLTHRREGENGEAQRNGENEEIAVDEIRDGHERLGRQGQFLVHPVEDLGDHGDHVTDKEEENARADDAHDSGIDEGRLDLCFHVRAALEQVRLILEDRIEGARLLARRHRIDEEVVEYLRVGLEGLGEGGAAFHLVAQKPDYVFLPVPVELVCDDRKGLKKGYAALEEGRKLAGQLYGQFLFYAEGKENALPSPLCCRSLLERDQIEAPVLYLVFRGRLGVRLYAALFRVFPSFLLHGT